MNKKKEKRASAKKDSAEEICRQCDEYLQGWKRALADYDNLQKELSQERVRLREQSIKDTIEMLVPVIDNFDQAVSFVPEGIDEQTKNWLQGIIYVRAQLDTILAQVGAESFGVVGEMFDPNAHTAIEEKTIKDKQTGEILSVVRRGWKLKEKIIRPAQVIVNT